MSRQSVAGLKRGSPDLSPAPTEGTRLRRLHDALVASPCVSASYADLLAASGYASVAQLRSAVNYLREFYGFRTARYEHGAVTLLATHERDFLLELELARGSARSE